MDQAVLRTQKWLNTTYKNNSHYSKIAEDGVTGWSTMKALVTALQIEIGVSSPDGSFGPATATAFNNMSKGCTKKNLVYILQGGLYCKGYNPGGFTGTFGDNTTTAVKKLQTDAGLSNKDGVVTALLMKAILSMDAFTLLTYGSYNGDSKIRTIQQNLNRDYSSNKYFAADIGLVPCDGIYGKSTNKALLYALQIEEGIAEPNGVFGPSTKKLCPVLSQGSTKKKFVYLLQYALYCNGYDPNGFDGGFGAGVKKAVSDFQSFCKLDADGVAGLKTWASLLVSTGDSSRAGTACDCATTLTASKASILVQRGYKYVGRYLTGKFAMKPSELEIIYNSGLKVFPIFEVGGYKLSYFNNAQGIQDANDATLAAELLGFKHDTIIYYTVDFDAVDDNVTNAIIPYFEGINQRLASLGNPYKVGIYAPRNVCSRVAGKGLSCSSFVCDMSTGFSGNLGYPLPKDWTFDQISTITIGGGDSEIQIDNNIYSDRNYSLPINSYDWKQDALNRGWGPISEPEYYNKILSVTSSSISDSITTYLKNNPLKDFYGIPGTDFVAFSNAIVNNEVYSVTFGNVKYDTTKPGFLRKYNYDSKGTIHLENELKLKSIDTIGNRFTKGLKPSLKVKLLADIDSAFMALGFTLGTYSDMVALAEKGEIKSNSEFAAALAAAIVQNGLFTYFSTVVCGVITQTIGPEFPILGAIVGAAFGATAGHILSAFAGNDLEIQLKNVLEWLFDELF